jgi:hypothetical protein
MSSMFSSLLLNLDIHFPKGKARIHRADRQEDKDMSACHAKGLARNEATYRENVEKTFAAIEAGSETPQQIVVAAKIGISTIRKTLDELMVDQRVYRVRHGNTFHYFVSKQ